ncbi:MAG: NAD(P)H-hydrate dehydratase [Rhodoferax sp.]
MPIAQDHKYSRGVLGVVTGSRHYPGAAVLSTSAALATGVGMVRFFPTSDLATLVLQRSPEVVIAPGKVNAWLLGSGVPSPGARSVSAWLRHRQMQVAHGNAAPTVLDAGGLHLAGSLQAPTLITPHAGELARLLTSRGMPTSAQAIIADPHQWAVRAQQSLAVTVLLKGASTVVAGPGIAITLPIATPWLATAGTGDVLAGIAGALVAARHAEFESQPTLLARVAATAAYLHANAAAVASAGAPLTGTSLIDAIGEALRALLRE